MLKEPVKELAERIFEDIPYSKLTEEVKEKVESSFQTEYENLQKSGKTEIQAMGSIMERYGTPQSAAALVGTGLSAETVPLEKKEFIRAFRKIKTATFFIAFCLSAALLAAVQGVMELSPLYIVTVILWLVLCMPFIYSYRKRSGFFKYDDICLSPKARNALYICLDRHKKRAINSVFLFVCGIILFASLTVERALVSSMNYDELIVLLFANQQIILLALIILIKNFCDIRFLLRFVSDREQTAFWKYIKKEYLVVLAGFLAIVLFTALSGIKLADPFIVLYLLNVIFWAVWAIVSFNRRKPLVRNNLVVNKPAISIITAAALVFVTVGQFQKDVYVLQPYIMGVSEVAHDEHVISYDKKTGEYTITADDKEFKILHLTDIHLGGSTTSSYKDYKALEACKRLIEHTKPDLVVVTGDLVFPMGIMSFSLNNEAPVIQFASFMRNLGIPWAFTYGNHDTETMATGSREELDELYKSLAFETSGTLLYPYIKPDITGRCNQLINIRNADGSIRQAVFLIDSNDYTGAGINEYDYIHDDQVEWYAEQVEKLSEEQGAVIPSMVFFHIPLQEYRTAYELYEKNSSEVKYFFGINGETMIDKVCCSDYPSKLFDTAVKLGSTKAMFCGHDHYNNMSLEYRGIRLTYGMSIDYLAMPGIDKRTEQRGAELITIAPDSSFDIEQIPLTSIT